ncbi:MAG TPA: hypothetical protein G4O02_11900 [Caldilineae bacterium]|nr:hypothetical protein [Caldilineae bacterium]
MRTAASMTIQEFNTLLKAQSTREDSPLLKVLRQIAGKDPKAVRHLVVKPTAVGWD